LLLIVQLPEPLTGKVWTLDDFEGSPALLVSCFGIVSAIDALFVF
jgi:hypothetical protein